MDTVLICCILKENLSDPARMIRVYSVLLKMFPTSNKHLATKTICLLLKQKLPNLHFSPSLLSPFLKTEQGELKLKFVFAFIKSIHH